MFKHKFRLIVVSAMFWARLAVAQTDTPQELVLVVDAPNLEVERVRSALQTELGVPVVASNNRSEGAALLVVSQISRGTLLLSYTAPDGQRLERTLERAATPEATIDNVRLIAGNLARNEANEILLALRRSRTPAADEKPEATPSQEPEKKPAVKPTVAPAVATTRTGIPCTNSIPYVSFLHPFSSNPHMQDRCAWFAFDFIYGRVGALRGISVGLGYTSVVDSSEGVMVGFLTHVGGSMRGLQLAEIGTIVNGPVEGFQAASLFNIQRSSVGAAAPRSSAFQFLGFQTAGIFNLADSMRGAQVAGVFNSSSRAELSGFQTAGIFNYAGDSSRPGKAGLRWSHGFQAAGVANRAGNIDGIQVAGVMNLARDVDGAQISVINVGGNVDGAQIGVLNIAERVSGTQIGVVNISKETRGLAVGVVNVGAPRTQFVSWAGSDALGHVGVRYRSGYLYSQVSAGVRFNQKITDKNQRPYGGFAIGTHFDITENFFAEADVLGLSRVGIDEQDSTWDWATHGRVSVGVSLGPVAVFAGGGGRLEGTPTDTNLKPYFMGGIQVF